MKLRSVATKALQIAVIALISFGASHVFWRVDAMIQVNGIHAYRYIAYSATVIFSYICTYKYNKYLAFSLPSVLSALAIFGQQKIVDSFPAAAPFFAILMGVFTVFIVPAAKGRGFVEFLFVLTLPALLAQSRLGGTIVPASEGIFTYEVTVVIVAVVGGYFYLRYTASTELTHQELSSRGASEEDMSTISQRNNFITGVIVAAATGTSALLAATAPIFTNVLKPYFAGLPLHILLLEIIIGVVVVTVIYYFRTTAVKRFRPNSTSAQEHRQP